jgi:hypothetical protein
MIALVFLLGAQTGHAFGKRAPIEAEGLEQVSSIFIMAWLDAAESYVYLTMKSGTH